MQKHLYIDELINILLKIRALRLEVAKGLADIFDQSNVVYFDAFLLQEGLVDKAGLLKALSILYQIPYADAEGYFFQTELLRMFPKDFLLRNVCIPYERDQNILVMLVADPSDDTLLAKIGEYVSYNIDFNIGIRTDIIDAIEEYYDKSLTQVSDEQQKLRMQDFDNLPVKQDDRDASVFLKSKIDNFTYCKTQEEQQDIEHHAHNVQRKK